MYNAATGGMGLSYLLPMKPMENCRNLRFFQQQSRNQMIKCTIFWYRSEFSPPYWDDVCEQGGKTI